MKRFLLFCLLALPSFAAFNGTTIWRVATTGADTNGGAFDPGVASPGTNESITGGAAITITTASTTTGTGSPAFSATTHGPGNFVHIASGTGCTTGWHEITSQAAGTATFESAIADAGGRTCVGVIGNPLATMGQAASLVVANNNVCVAAGTYTSGTITLSNGGTQGSPVTFQGYTTTCGVNGAISDFGRPTLKVNAGGINLVAITGADIHFVNFNLDDNGQTNDVGIEVNAARPFVANVTATGFHLGLDQGGQGSLTLFNFRSTAEPSGCAQGFKVTNGTILFSMADTNACVGVYVAGQIVSLVGVIGANNTGASGYGIYADDTQFTGTRTCTLCIMYGNAQDGFIDNSLQNCAQFIMVNSWAWGNGGKSFNCSAGTVNGTYLFNYNGYASGSLGGFQAGPNDVTLTADPSVAGASLNFALNTTTGGGALLKAAGFPGVLAGTGFMSIGTIQPNPSAGGAGAFAFVQ